MMEYGKPHQEMKAPPRKVVIEARDLRKTFGDIHAVRGVSFKVYEGEVPTMEREPELVTSSSIAYLMLAILLVLAISLSIYRLRQREHIP